jgi:hypothetical protein
LLERAPRPTSGGHDYYTPEEYEQIYYTQLLGTPTDAAASNKAA